MTDQPKSENPRHVELYQALRKKLQALYRRDQFEIHDKVLLFHDYLKMKYPNAREHRLFHLISGSTLKDFYGDLDLPGEDSVRRFIDREYAAAFPDGEPVEDKAESRT